VGSATTRKRRVVLAFWLASGLAAAGGVAPLVIALGTNRITGVVLPFAVAAIVFAACARLYDRGRSLTALIDFIGNLAIVYGILALLAVPLRLAVTGECPAAPAACTSGLERPLTEAESAGLGLAIGIGIVAILTGFFGLVVLYQHRVDAGPPPAQPATPPVRRIPPVGATPPTQGASAPAPGSAAVPAALAELEPVAEVEPEAPAEVPELPAPEEELELPAPAEELELPAPVEEPELPAHVAADPVEPLPPAPAPKPPRKRKPGTQASPPTPPPAPPPTPTDSGE
jgi:hypothetical protein